MVLRVLEAPVNQPARDWWGHPGHPLHHRVSPQKASPRGAGSRDDYPADSGWTGACRRTTPSWRMCVA